MMQWLSASWCLRMLACKHFAVSVPHPLELHVGNLHRLSTLQGSMYILLLQRLCQKQWV